MLYSKQVIKINTQITDVEKIKKMVQPIVDFANQHDIAFELGCSDTDNKLISICEAEGRTSAYCKGMVSEVKQMLKDIFHCKLDVLFYAY